MSTYFRDISSAVRYVYFTTNSVYIFQDKIHVCNLIFEGYRLILLIIHDDVRHIIVILTHCYNLYIIWCQINFWNVIKNLDLRSFSSFFRKNIIQLLLVSRS